MKTRVIQRNGDVRSLKKKFFSIFDFFIREYLGRQIEILEIFALVQGAMIACLSEKKNKKNNEKGK